MQRVLSIAAAVELPPKALTLLVRRRWPIAPATAPLLPLLAELPFSELFDHMAAFRGLISGAAN